MFNGVAGVIVLSWHMYVRGFCQLGGAQFRLKELIQKWVRLSRIEREVQRVASTALKLGGEHSQSSGASSLEGLTSSRAL